MLDLIVESWYHVQMELSEYMKLIIDNANEPYPQNMDRMAEVLKALNEGFAIDPDKVSRATMYVYKRDLRRMGLIDSNNKVLKQPDNNPKLAKGVVTLDLKKWINYEPVRKAVAFLNDENSTYGPYLYDTYVAVPDAREKFNLFLEALLCILIGNDDTLEIVKELKNL